MSAKRINRRIRKPTLRKSPKNKNEKKVSYMKRDVRVTGNQPKTPRKRKVTLGKPVTASPDVGSEPLASAEEGFQVPGYYPFSCLNTKLREISHNVGQNVKDGV